MGEPDDLRGQAPPTGVQHPTVGIGEAGEIEAQQLHERPLGVIEAGLELLGRRAERRDGGLVGRGQRAAGIAQQCVSRRGVARDAPGLEQRGRLPRTEAVSRDRVGQPGLVGPRHGGEGVRRRRRDPAVIHGSGDAGRQPAAEDEAAIDPPPAAAEQLGNLCRRELIVVGERPDDTGLVHGTDRAPRAVRVEQPRFAHDAGGVLDDDRDVRVPVARPLRQALEPVEDVVGAIIIRGDAHREWREPAGGIGARAAQRCQRGSEALDRHLPDRAHGRAASSGSSW